jgi:hypothetical protein
MSSHHCPYLAVVAAIALTSATHSAIVGTSLGSAPPPPALGAWPLTDFLPDPAPLFVNVLSAPSPIVGVVGFNPALNHRLVGVGWATWCHGYMGDVYWTNGATAATLTPPALTTAFAFYAVPNPFGSFVFTATGTTQSGATAVVSGTAGDCAGFGFHTTDPCDPIVSVVVSSTVDFAVGEFSISAAACAPPPCPEDLDGSGSVTGLDLALLLGVWTGAAVYAPCPPFQPADLNHDCKVNGLDLALLLGGWGPCP